MELLRSEYKEPMLGFIESLANTEDLEKRATAISLLETLLKELEMTSSLTEQDVQFLRSINMRLRDAVETLKQGKDSKVRILINHLLKIINTIEDYIRNFYEKYGYLPPYTYGDYSYFRRRSEEYGFPYYSYYPYYFYNYPELEKPKIKIKDKVFGHVEITEDTKDKIMACLTSKGDTSRDIWDRPNESFEEFFNYNILKLKEYIDELKAKRLNQEQQLSDSKPTYEKVLEKFVDMWLKVESKRWNEI
ncbi:MAG: hypothetical protein QXH03_03545 [Candidatus Bathyarchaeia archaeon]